jgi:hypothetical protein
VGATADLLGPLRPRIEAEIKPRLSGLFGGFVRAYLPQTWVFRTEDDSASLVVDARGDTTVTPKALPNPDVTVEGPAAALQAALGGKGRPAHGAVKVTPHTAKGRAAFDYLRPRFGL